MIKIYKGKKFDTATGEFLGNSQYSAPNDLHYFNESLYMTKAGEFFIHAEGGAASKYAKPIGQNW